MRRNMSGNLGLYKYLWPGSVYVDAHDTTVAQDFCESGSTALNTARIRQDTWLVLNK